MRRMIRGIIDSIVEGAIKRVSMKGIAGESISSREAFQHYGFTSRALAGAEGILVRDGNHLVLIAEDDRRYRIALAEGEVALYTDEGDKIHLKRGRVIEIVGGEQVTVATKVLEATASLSATVISPEINLGGARGGLRRLIDERFKALFDNHAHSNVQPGSGTTGPPTAALDVAACSTDATRGI